MYSETFQCLFLPEDGVRFIVLVAFKVISFSFKFPYTVKSIPVKFEELPKLR